MSSEDKTPEVEQQKKQEPEGEVSGLVLENYSFTTAAAIVGYVDRKYMSMSILNIQGRIFHLFESN